MDYELLHGNGFARAVGGVFSQRTGAGGGVFGGFGQFIEQWHIWVLLKSDIMPRGKRRPHARAYLQ